MYICNALETNESTMKMAISKCEQIAFFLNLLDFHLLNCHEQHLHLYLHKYGKIHF